MSAGVYFREDIANALLGTAQSMTETSSAIGGGDTVRTAAFHAGHRSAISTMALFFGISPGLVLPEGTASHMIERG